PKRERSPCPQIPHLDRRVDAPARQNVRIKVETHYALGMARECADALAPPPVPDLEGVVHAPSDELDLVELESTNGTGVALQTVQLLSRLHVPNADGAVVRAGDQDGEGWVGERFIKLKTHDP